MTRTAPATTSSTSFGTVAAPMMVVAETSGGAFGQARTVPLAPLELHPFTHALHYGSACFEGLKAHRGDDGVVRLFRARRHAERLAASAQRMSLPVPDASLVDHMIEEVVVANLDVVPESPGALYVRPVLLGVEPNIGAAAAPSREALLYVIASPVGDYFAGGARPLTLLVEQDVPRTTPQFGRVKAGANYATALSTTLEARERHDADQVLFALGGFVQETGAANFLLLDDVRVVTPALDDAFLHGVTRDALLTLARDAGMHVEERPVHVDELADWALHGEAALAGTAAVLASVGTLVLDARRIPVGEGDDATATRHLRERLVAVQQGRAADIHGWTRPVG